MTLRARLLAAAVLLISSLGVSGYLIIRTVETSELQQLDNQLRTSIPIAARIARNSAPPSTEAPPTPRAESLSDSYLAVITAGKRTVIAQPQAVKGKEPRIPTSVASSITTARPVTVPSVSGSGRWRAILSRTPDGREVLVAAYMGAVDATTSELRTAVIVAGGVVAAVLLAAGFWIERLGLRPIAAMKQVAEAIVAGDRKRRVAAATSGAETADLAAAFNSMLDEQNVIEDRLRQFVADASHELRTPTAVISGLTQLWRQGDLRDGQALQDAMRRIGQESARMRALVEELLLLARLDEGTPLHYEAVDLTALVGDVLENAASTHPSREIIVHLDPAVSVPGEPAALRRVVSNLVTNALIHTEPSSAITVRLTGRRTESLLAISDAGPGMDTTQAGHAFDRFWRAESSRTRMGSGLGLSIAQAIVAAHGGDIRLESTPKKGTVVRVRLPIPSRPDGIPNGTSGMVSTGRS
jgi:two-component system OmpR family sensor kinase